MGDPTTIALNLTFLGTLAVALVMFFGLFLVFVATLVIAGLGQAVRRDRHGPGARAVQDWPQDRRNLATEHHSPVCRHHLESPAYRSAEGCPTGQAGEACEGRQERSHPFARLGRRRCAG
ncbi:hypothetical protein ACOM2C_11915 [Pseudarthrobacter sp. So.54]